MNLQISNLQHLISEPASPRAKYYICDAIDIEYQDKRPFAAGHVGYTYLTIVGAMSNTFMQDVMVSICEIKPQSEDKVAANTERKLIKHSCLVVDEEYKMACYVLLSGL
ncbi:hypothetical protein EAE99_004184 [Botrytis elliptica]|nr:hypothetical protein EAE99_004184 [Botrytis elliptica]